MEEWKTVFKTFSNINRLKIIKLLQKHNRLSVGEFSDKLDISVQATSNHLAMLFDLGVVKSKGKDNTVVYFLNKHMSNKFQAAIKLLRK